MAHSPYCEEGDGQVLAVPGKRDAWREWWPDQGAEIDVSTLVAITQGANPDITNPQRLPPVSGDGLWLGIWGNYSGLRIGFSPTDRLSTVPAG